ncbi:MAG: 1,4-alpha-glucan branching protein GlgB [Mycobacteriales bacterium]
MTDNRRGADPTRRPGSAPLSPSPPAAGGVGPAPTAGTPPGGLDRAELDRLAGGAHHDPHAILGAHPLDEQRTVIRTLRPGADAATALVGGARITLDRIHDSGIFAGQVSGPVGDYRIETSYDGLPHLSDDPYRWLPTLGDVDLHLIGEGRHERLWDVLGAHVRRYDTAAGTVQGVSFAVWAPSARGVSVIGEFSYWKRGGHPMRSLGSSGVWELFIPGLGAGTKYRFAVLGADSVWREKADPMAFASEPPPATASVVFDPKYHWDDGDWLGQRARTGSHEAPMSCYEVHLGSWRPGLSYRDLAERLTDYVRDTGFTHVELMPVAEHPFGGSWGYHITGYYAPTARFGNPDDFRYLVDRLHQAGIGVLMDWVPGHFATDEWALVRFDGTALYEHPDPQRGWHPEWGSYIFNHGRTEVRNFLVANAVYWLEEFHIDGLRVDGVASMLYLDYSRKSGEWTPNQYGGRENIDAVGFLQEMNATVYKRVPGAVTIAEESTAWPGVTRPTHVGGLGFGFKWNMGWMHDTLSYISHDPVHRAYHHNEMTFSMVYAYSENYLLPISHDEVVHGKGSIIRKIPGDRWQQRATMRALYAFMWAHPGKQLLFMGCEFGQDAEWDEARSLSWWLLDVPEHAALAHCVSDLNRVYRETPALWQRDVEPSGFRWIDANDSSGNVFSFLRRDAEGREVACVANFSPVPHDSYRLGLPRPGHWREILNTDAESYGGSGVGNMGAVTAYDVEWHGLPHSAILRVPPLGVLWLAPDGE